MQPCVYQLSALCNKQSQNLDGQAALLILTGLIHVPAGCQLIWDDRGDPALLHVALILQQVGPGCVLMAMQKGKIRVSPLVRLIFRPLLVLYLLTAIGQSNLHGRTQNEIGRGPQNRTRSV